MTEASPRALRWIGSFAGMFLGGVLLVAAAAKAVNPAAFGEEIHAQGLDVMLGAGALALLALAAEAGLGTALLLGVRRRATLLPAAALVVFFVVLNARSYWRSTHGQLDDASCGCFGNLVERSPAEAFWTDLVLLVPPLGLAFVGRGPGRVAGRLVVAGVAALAVAGFAWRAPALPLDNLATRLRPGTRADELCAGRSGDRVCLSGVLPEAESGRHVVVLAALDDVLASALGRLDAYVDAEQGPRLWVLTAASPEDERKFYWRFGPKFKIETAPQALLRPLYRTLPRSFLLEDGVVRETWPGLPPLERLAGETPSVTVAHAVPRRSRARSGGA